MKKLNLGCGKKQLKGFINADIQLGPNIDLTFNFDEFPYPIEENEFDYILLDNVLEHLIDPVKVLDELRRIAKKDAEIRIIVPYYNCCGAYNDITHKHFFNERTFELMVKPESGYSINAEGKNKFEIKEMNLIPTRLGKLIPFKSLRRKFSWALGDVIKNIDLTIIVKK